MDFSIVQLTPEHEALQRDVRAFMQQYVTQDVLDDERRNGDRYNDAVHLALGERGWIMPDWSADVHGLAWDPVCTYILESEMWRAEMPYTTLSTTTLVASTVAAFGSPELVDEVLPRVANGTARICLGYTEPDGGSDIAAARVRAVRDGDEWVINGSKIFTSGAQNCQYVFLITRTDPTSAKHRGLTMFLVPLDSPGIEVQGLRTYSGEQTSIVYYTDVRVPDRYRIGAVNDGWRVLHGPLDKEHSVGAASEADRYEDRFSLGARCTDHLSRALDAAVEWAKTHVRPDGSHPIDDPLVRLRLGRVAIEIEAAFVTIGPMGRIRGSEALIEGMADLVELVAPDSLIPWPAPDAVGAGRIEFLHRFAPGTATYAGTVEIYRNIIAQQILGLPRPEYPGSKFLVDASRPSTDKAAQ
jgi:alkylation response protein AidB-like acyl-CoA dehydrogenase